jgi:hypothetical protein
LGGITLLNYGRLIIFRREQNSLRGKSIKKVEKIAPGGGYNSFYSLKPPQIIEAIIFNIIISLNANYLNLNPRIHL